LKLELVMGLAAVYFHLQVLAVLWEGMTLVKAAIGVFSW
jgi:hypothetical protein